MTITSLTALLVVVFVSRSVKDILSGLNIAVLEFNDPVLEVVPVQTLLFAIYFVWEVIPAMMVLGLFWHIPDSGKIIPSQTPRSSYSANASSINSSSTILTDYNSTVVVSNGQKISISPVLAPTNIFNNPARYDSDPDINSPTRGSIPQFKAAGNKPITGYSTRSPLLQAKDSPFDD